MVMSPVGRVDDVQELRRRRPTGVPARFVRDEDERPNPDALVPPMSTQLPLISLSRLMEGKGDDGRCELYRLAEACRDWGFFQVVEHGVDPELMERMEKVATEFFMLPVEEKRKYPMTPGKVQGYGQAFVFSEDQKLDWCNMFALGVEPRAIRIPELWPKTPPDFSETVDRYSRQVRKTCDELLSCISRSLGLRDARLRETFGEAVQAVRMNYYPPCSRPDLVLGLSPHSDGSALTVLQQSPRPASSAGLQILKDGKWFHVHPIPNAFVINIGDTIEVLSNGRYKSVEHRAVTDGERDRLSLVTFYAPSYDVEVGPLGELMDEGNPRMYRTYNHGEYSRNYVSQRLQGKKPLDFAKLP
ncbi:hypothetical protein MLD38_019645 [Melastoma candidum]|uniref:Uncharacterized protein n=1 Tax=Melastoma candidum TaxID=119954 RepID=A0ACB9R172_9MYRT|nr:hypothetical protein MLD38_019645 [Melastoma candidum]